MVCKDTALTLNTINHALMRNSIESEKDVVRGLVKKRESALEISLSLFITYYVKLERSRSIHDSRLRAHEQGGGIDIRKRNTL